MKRYSRLLTSALSLIALAACGQSPQMMPNPQMRPFVAGVRAAAQPIQPIRNSLPAGQGARQVTSFSYLALDNNLAGSAGTFLNAVETSAGPAGYYPAFVDLEGDANSFVSLLMNDGDPSKFGSPADHLDTRRKSGTPQEVNSGDPAVLAQTVNWAFSNYPAQRKVMTISTHGAGYLGIVSDDHSGSQGGFSAQTFAAGLRSGLKGRQLDVLNMSSCLMSNLEALYELHGTAQVVLASEDSMLSSRDTEHDYVSEFNRVVAQPGLSPQAIGKHMAIFGQAKNPTTGFYTLSAIDMNQIPVLKQQVNLLGQALLRALPAHGAAIHRAYGAVPFFSLGDGMGQRDLYNFATGLMHTVADPNVKQAANAVRAQVRKTLIHHRDKEGAAANGISIFMPRPHHQWEPRYAQQAYPSSRFGRDTAWDDFLIAYLNMVLKS